MRIHLLAAALAGTVLGGAAVAGQTTPAPAPEAPVKHHVNRGPLTRADFVARTAKSFARIDAKGDDAIDGSEIGGAVHGPVPEGAKGERRKQRMMDRFDANHDGKVSADEIGAAAGARFDRMDTNHDGVLDETERAATRHRVHAPMRAAPGEVSPTPPPGKPDPDAGQ